MHLVLLALTTAGHPAGLISRPDAPRVAGMLILDKIYFARNSAVLSDTSHRVIRQTARDLNRHLSLRVQVRGHAATGERDLWRLSAQRARDVLEALVKAGVARFRLSMRAFGDSRPLQGRADAMRRVEFQVLRTAR